MNFSAAAASFHKQRKQWKMAERKRGEKEEREVDENEGCKLLYCEIFWILI